jgi:hypothetical protein
VPEEIQALLRFSSGISIGADRLIDLTGSLSVDAEGLLPRYVTICKDSYGNHWCIDIRRAPSRWGPVVYLCHDPPVLVIVSHGLAEFLEAYPGVRQKSRVEAKKIWSGQLDFPTALSLRRTADPELAEVLSVLSDDTRVADLRSEGLGTGLPLESDGRLVIERIRDELIFAITIG